MTREQALSLRHGQIVSHVRLRNADGTFMRARVSGKAKTWKTRPGEFQIPMKHGLRNSFYLTHENCYEWSL